MRGRPGACHPVTGGLLAACLAALALPAPADEAKDARARGVMMLADIKNVIKGRYYDKTYRGVALDAHFDRAKAEIQQVQNEGQVGAILSRTLAAFRDSHTYFIPPMRPYLFDYGFESRVVGDDAFVIDAPEDADPFKKGVRRGDRLLSVEGVRARRGGFAGLWYALNVAFPRKQLRLSVRTGDAPPRDVVVDTKVEERRKNLDIEEWFDEIMDRFKKSPSYAWSHWTYKEESVSVVRLYTFMVSEESMNELLERVKESKALVLDLRGNGGGSIEALRTVGGAFFPDEMELGSEVGRRGPKPFKSRKPKSKRFYSGTLVVLVDSASASSAEVLARALQLEKRAVIVGDRTAGAAMIAEHVPLASGNEMKFFVYGVAVTIADLRMRDGESLEGRGMTPDEIVLPSGDDLREGRDPAMARAAALAGLELSPEAAWSHFRPKEEPPKKNDGGKK